MFRNGTSMVSVVDVVKLIIDVLPLTLMGVLRFVRTRSQYASANIPANSTRELIKYIQTWCGGDGSGDGDVGGEDGSEGGGGDGSGDGGCSGGENGGGSGGGNGGFGCEVGGGVGRGEGDGGSYAFLPSFGKSTHVCGLLDLSSFVL